MQKRNRNKDKRREVLKMDKNIRYCPYPPFKHHCDEDRCESCSYSKEGWYGGGVNGDDQVSGLPKCMYDHEICTYLLLNCDNCDRNTTSQNLKSDGKTKDEIIDALLLNIKLLKNQNKKLKKEE